MPEGRNRALTPLLELITQESLDQDYQVAAARRSPEREVSGGAGRSARWAGVAVLAVFALLVTVAAVQTSRNADVNNASKAALESRIEAHRKTVSDRQQDLADLRDATTTDERKLNTLGQRLSSTRARAASLGALTGFTAVTGPAVEMTIDNADYADDSARIRDSDIALLVDAFWAAGAEAISVNGQRVTARTGIRNSGPAVEVNAVGVAPPYTIVAIGDTDQLAADLLNSGAGQDFMALARQYGFQFDVDNVDQVRMGAAPGALARLRSARRTGPGGKQEGSTS